MAMQRRLLDRTTSESTPRTPSRDRFVEAMRKEADLSTVWLGDAHAVMSEKGNLGRAA
jgi:hypothetical protein